MRPLILVTNDDGISSPGLRAAAQAAATLGDVVVCAPREEQTGMSRAFTSLPLTGVIEEIDLGIESRYRLRSFAVVGTPAQAVSYAVIELLERLPDLCISGINFGENVGSTVTCSGTVGAAWEADSYGVQSVAISLRVEAADTPHTVSWDASMALCSKLGKLILDGKIPKAVSLLNINVPRDANGETEIRRTIDSRQPLWVFGTPERVSLDTPTRLPLYREIDDSTLEPDSDIQALLEDGVVSVTPIASSLAYRGPLHGLPAIFEGYAS